MKNGILREKNDFYTMKSLKIKLGYKNEGEGKKEANISFKYNN